LEWSVSIDLTLGMGNLTEAFPVSSTVFIAGFPVSS